MPIAVALSAIIRSQTITHFVYKVIFTYLLTNMTACWDQDVKVHKPV